MIMPAVCYLPGPVNPPDGCLLFASEWWRKIKTGVFSFCVIERAGKRHLAAPLSGIDVYIQPDWWICQSCVTPAVSEIVHLPPCKIALNWGNPSVAAPRGALINFTARRREPSVMHLHTDAGPHRQRRLWRTSLVNILIHRQACWYCHTLKRQLWAILSRWK